MNRYKPTTQNAAEIRATAKSMGYKVRVAVSGWSIRVIGKFDEVRDLAVLAGLSSACGDAATKPHTVPNYDGQTEFFGYIHA
jgi:hypothetical protein